MDDHDPNAEAVQHVEDLSLVRRALLGTRADVDRLADRFARIPAFLSAINRRRGAPLSREDLEDLGQDVAYRILEKLDAYHGRGTLDNWLYRFCLLEFMNRLRRKSRAPTHEHLAVEPPSREVRSDIDPDEIAGQLGRLPENEAETIELRHFEELAFEEIAERLEIPRGTAKSRYYSGLSRLRIYMREAWPKEPA